MFEKLKHNKWVAAVIFGLSLVANGLAGTKLLGGNTTAEVSNAYSTLFTPAGFTFAIWGVIYTLLIIYCVRSCTLSKKNQTYKMIQQITPYFLLVSMLNLCWIFAWQYRVMWLSVLLIIGMLVVLIKISRILMTKKLSQLDWATIRLPFSIYFGWITVATIANIAVFLVSISWNGWGIAAETWTLLVLVVGAIVGIATALLHMDWSYAIVFAWAYFGILMRHIGDARYIDIITLVAILFLILCLLTTYLVVRWPIGNVKSHKELKRKTSKR